MSTENTPGMMEDPRTGYVNTVPPSSEVIPDSGDIDPAETYPISQPQGPTLPETTPEWPNTESQEEQTVVHQETVLPSAEGTVEQEESGPAFPLR